MSDDDQLVQLQRSPVFGVACPATLKTLARCAQVRRVAVGAFVFHDGDSGDAAFIVTAGRVKLVATSASGREVVLATVGPRGGFGELAALDGGARSAAAVALCRLTLLAVPGRAIRDAVRGDPALAESFLVALAALVRRSNEQRADLLFLDLAGRVAKHLLAELVPGDSVVVLDLKQGDLAQFVGGSRQSVNQILHSLDRDGIIELDGRRVTVRSVGRLRRLAGM